VIETYVIRIGIRAEGDAATGQGELRGTVEHVGSGRRESFHDARALIAFLQSVHGREPEERSARWHARSERIDDQERRLR
jgi:hypothetical protein